MTKNTNQPYGQSPNDLKQIAILNAPLHALIQKLRLPLFAAGGIAFLYRSKPAADIPEGERQQLSTEQRDDILKRTALSLAENSLANTFKNRSPTRR